MSVSHHYLSDIYGDSDNNLTAMDSVLAFVAMDSVLALVLHGKVVQWA